MKKLFIMPFLAILLIFSVNAYNITELFGGDYNFNNNNLIQQKFDYSFISQYYNSYTSNLLWSIGFNSTNYGNILIKDNQLIFNFTQKGTNSSHIFFATELPGLSFNTNSIISFAGIWKSNSGLSRSYFVATDSSYTKGFMFPINHASCLYSDFTDGYYEDDKFKNIPCIYNGSMWNVNGFLGSVNNTYNILLSNIMSNYTNLSYTGLDIIGFLYVNNVALSNENLTISNFILSNILTDNIINSNHLPSFSIESNATSVHLNDAGLAEWRYNINANDPEGDQIYYSMQEPFSQQLKGHIIDFDTDYYGPVSFMEGPTQFIGCELVPGLIGSTNIFGINTCTPAIKDNIQFDKNDLSYVSTMCNQSNKVFDFLGWNVGYGIIPVFKNNYQGYVDQVNSSMCSGPVGITMPSAEGSDFKAAVKVGLDLNSKVFVFMHGDTIDTIPMLLNRTVSGIDIHYPDGSIAGPFDTSSLAIIYQNNFNNATYDIFVYDGDKNYSVLLGQSRGFTLSSHVIQGIGFYGILGVYWFDDAMFFKMSQIATNWSTTYNTPFTYNKIGVYNYRFYVTDSLHLNDYSNYEDISVNVLNPSIEVSENLTNPIDNKVIKNTPLIVFAVPLWGIYSGLGVDKYVTPWLWIIYIIGLLFLTFCMKQLQVAFMSINLIFFGLMILGFIPQSVGIVIVFLLALSFTPYLAALFQVGQDK